MDYGENGGKVEITNPITNTWDEPLMMMVVDSKYQMKSLGFTTGGIIGSISLTFDCCLSLLLACVIITIRTSATNITAHTTRKPMKPGYLSQATYYIIPNLILQILYVKHMPLPYACPIWHHNQDC